MLPRRQPPPEKLDPADPPLTPRPRGDMSGSASRSRGQYARNLAAPHPGRRPAIAGSRSPLTSHSVGRPTFPARPGGIMSRGSWYAATLLSLCAPFPVQAQNREVTGKVVNATTKEAVPYATVSVEDRKSTRLNSSHLVISYAVFCLKKKTKANRSSPHDE